MTDSAADGYGGLFGAFPYAFRRSDSRLFRLYVVAGGLLAALLGLGFGLAFVVSIAQSTGLAAGGTSSFVRTFVLMVGFLVVLPVVGPVLLVARHHRREGSDARYDRAVAAAGLVYLLSLYLLVVASIPPEFVLDGEPTTRPVPRGVFAPVISLLYAVPAVASPLIPAAAAALVWLVHRRYR
ncbi:hypothetical protein [Halosegnis marinus]|uniref:DUF8056 domain-containing protein n=1 Tax=Halosegnis marinus TaxID=3034023 RepID=A0ABD5ZPY2_9EURY|nr:hypothetical protein [Halosegnis sp. DT85]